MMKNVKKRTVIFLGFMLSFFLTAAFFTYYSGVVYWDTLPVVETVLPKAAEEYENGRMTYQIPSDAIYRKDANAYYILTARYVVDDLGKRYQAAEVAVWILDRMQDGWVRVDGIVWEEPVIIGAEVEIQKWDSIRVE